MNNTQITPKKSHASGKDKGLLIGKEAICRLLPIHARTLARMIEEGKPEDLLRLIHRFPGTNAVWAWEKDIIAYRDRMPSVAVEQRRGRPRKSKAVAQ